MLAQILNELVEEWVQKDMSWYVMVVSEQCFEALKDHLCWNLVDLSVAFLAFVVLKETTD